MENRLPAAVVVKIYSDDYVNACRNYCAANGIGRLPDATLKDCFRLPVTGVEVQFPQFKELYFPVGNGRSASPHLFKRLGQYATHNGCVSFVHCDGQTYVAKGPGIIQELIDLGYREEHFSVPFSSGEYIIHPEYRKKWESLPVRR